MGGCSLDEHALFQEYVGNTDYDGDQTTEENEVSIFNLVGRKKCKDAHRGTCACPGATEDPVLANKLGAVEERPSCGEQVAYRVDLTVVVTLDLKFIVSGHDQRRYHSQDSP